MAEPKGHIEGKNNGHKVLLYALSTCIWCRKTRQYLEDEGVEFDYIYVDLVDMDERKEAREHIREFSTSTSFPATIIDEKECVIGFKPERLKEYLEL